MIVRSVVRPCYRAEKAPDVFTRYENAVLKFLKRDRKTELLTPDDTVLPSNPSPLSPYTLDDKEQDAQECSQSDRISTGKRVLDDYFEDSIEATTPQPSLKKMKAKHPAGSNLIENDEATDSLQSVRNQDLPSNENTIQPHSVLERSPNISLPSTTPAVNIIEDTPYTQDNPSHGEEEVPPDLMDTDLQEDISTAMEHTAVDRSEDELFDCISSHKWDKGVLLIELSWKTGETSLCPFSIVKKDYPVETASYILKHQVGLTSNRKKTGRYLRWATALQRGVRQTLRIQNHFEHTCSRRELSD